MGDRASLLDGFTVGAYRVYPRREQIAGPDATHHVEPRVMQVLVTLAADAGSTVSRKEILEEVWHDVVVGDEVLSRAVSLLRGYFGDERTRPQYIRTVPRIGYELIAEVGALPAAEPETPPEREAPPAREPDPTPARAPGPDPIPAPAAPEPAPGRAAFLRKRAAHRSRNVTLGLISAAVLVVLAIAVATRFLPTPPSRATVAVLPLTVTGDEVALGYVADGLADYLTSQLSRSTALKVVARRSSFGFRDTEANVRVIGEQLGAGHLVEGSLGARGDELLLTLYLVETESGTNLWTTQLTGSTGDLTRLQELTALELTRALEGKLGVALPDVDPGQPRVAESAYRKYLEARYQWALRGERRTARAIELLEEAIVLEPGFADAHLALAQTLAVHPFYTSDPLGAYFTRARDSARRVLTLAPDREADVLALEGFMLSKELRWPEALESLRRAITLDPDNVLGHYWYSILLSQLGRYDAALGHIQTAQRLDPVSAILNDRLALGYVWVDDLEAAAARHRAAAELGYEELNQPLGHLWFLFRTGQLAEIERVLVRLGGARGWVEPLVRGLADAGARAEATRAIEAARASGTVPEPLLFAIWTVFGDTDRAFRDFSADPKMAYLELVWAPEAEHLRRDPRFGALLESVNLDEISRAAPRAAPAAEPGAATGAATGPKPQAAPGAAG